MQITQPALTAAAKIHLKRIGIGRIAHIVQEAINSTHPPIKNYTLMKCPKEHVQTFWDGYVKRGKATGRCDQCNKSTTWEKA